MLCSSSFCQIFTFCLLRNKDVYIKRSSSVKKTFTYQCNKVRDYKMPEPIVNIVKLAVGVQSVEELALIQQRFLSDSDNHKINYFYYTTKLMPKKHTAIVESGSLYWVIKGVICARQKIVAITKQKDSDGINRCYIFLDNSIVKTTPIRKRPFQGWRYLKKNKTPADIVDPVTGNFDDDIPLEIQQQLLEVGLL